MTWLLQIVRSFLFSYPFARFRNTTSQTATLIREYMPSVHRTLYGLAAGMVEIEKHASDAVNNNNTTSSNDTITTTTDTEQQQQEEDRLLLTAAQHELEEECRLQGGTWIRLTHTNIAMDKYSTTGLHVYLVLDPHPIDVQKAKPRDVTEEGMTVHAGITVRQIEHLIVNGDMTVVGGWASLLALHKLREMGEI